MSKNFERVDLKITKMENIKSIEELNSDEIQKINGGILIWTSDGRGLVNWLINLFR